MNKYTIMAALASAIVSIHSNAQTFGATTQIWQQRSLYRNIIVLEGNGHRCLTFGKRSARQSCIEIENPTKLIFGYTQIMFDAVNLLPSMNRVLIIGIGGGSLPMAIRHHFPETLIDAVELDPEVINIAQKYFKFRPDRKLSVFAEDGRVFIRKAIRDGITYDAILLDAFDKDYIPEHMATTEFLGQVKSVLKKDGILIANTFIGTGFQQYEEATYQNIFGAIYESITPNGNRIVLAGANASKIAQVLPGARVVRPSKAPVMTDKFAPVNTLLTHRKR